MRRQRRPLHLGILLSAFSLYSAQAKLITYTFPPEFPTSEIYDVSIDGQAVPAYQTKKGSFLSFGMTGSVELTVTYKNAPKEVVVRPLSAGVTTSIAGSMTSG